MNNVMNAIEKGTVFSVEKIDGNKMTIKPTDVSSNTRFSSHNHFPITVDISKNPELKGVSRGDEITMKPSNQRTGSIGSVTKGNSLSVQPSRARSNSVGDEGNGTTGGRKMSQ